jgi:hypothetical protein
MFSVLYGMLPQSGTGKMRHKYFKHERDARKWAADSLIEGSVNYITVTKPKREMKPSERTGTRRAF